MGGGASIPEPISTTGLISEEPGATAAFRSSLQEHGFVRFQLDDELEGAILQYLGETKKYFALESATKDRLSATLELMKKNEGYLRVEKVKEYLKLRKAAAKDLQVPEVPELVSSFSNCFDNFYKLVKKCFTAIATTPTDQGTPYINNQLIEVVNQQMENKSSVSVIHYLPRAPPGEREPCPGYEDDEDGMNIPSKSHTDTGLLTFILCSDVPGLQISGEDNKWIPVETICTPKKELFCIMGRKIEIFGSQEDPLYKATIHRVGLPYNVERYSILFFADVPA
eukprot:TRINITY_DN4668_c0_g1_i1.p1 TRINITY_DN4668_c0_g1~~TRINITY_DN4668_c0_g1_i1.p1  ORF type:complete len:282 (+),score=71.59 TRINITY_DN4668_c0_g1_i1:40-885(+)